MCILINSTTTTAEPIAMASHSNVRSSEETAEPIAMASHSNVRSSNNLGETTAQTLTPNVRSTPVGEGSSQDQTQSAPPLHYESDSSDDDSDVEEDVNDTITRRFLRSANDALFVEMIARVRRRRARSIRLAAAAQRVLVLIAIERQQRRNNIRRRRRLSLLSNSPSEPPLEEHSRLGGHWEQYFRMAPDLFGGDTIAGTIRDGVFQTTGINLPYLAAQATSGTLIDRVTSEIEKLVFLYGALREQGSWTGVAATIMLYVRTHYSGSLHAKLSQIFASYFETLEPQSAFNNWMDLLKTSHTNWRLATQNEGFAHVSKLLSLLVGAGLIEASNLTCDIAGMKLFSELCVPKFVSAFDIFNAIANCVVFFVEGGYECIQAGSIKPLLFGEKDFTNFENEFLECQKQMDYAVPGNYAMLGVDENAVVKKLEDATQSGKTLANITKNPFSKKLTLDRVGKLQQWESVLKQHRLSAGVRMKPYCVVVYGATGVGKSTIAPLLMYHILSPNGFDASDDACVMMKAGAKHEENYRTYINGVYYDDFANTKAEFTSESPCEDLLDTVNTARSTARMAALELKSKVSKQPKAVVVSTNVKDLNATKYSEEPASITRRADVFLTFRVREQFQTNGMLDSKKVESHYDGNVPTVPDLWEIDVQISCPMPNPTPGCSAVIGWKDVVWNGKRMCGVDMKTTLQYIVVSSKQHFEFQKSMVERSTSLASKIELCPTCKSSSDICVCGLACNVSFANPEPAPAAKNPPKLSRPLQPPIRENNIIRQVPVDDYGYSLEDSLGNAMWLEENARKQGKRQRPPRRRGRRDDVLEEHAALDAISADVLLLIQNLEHLSRFKFDWLVPERLLRKKSVLAAVEYYITHENALYHAAFGLFIPCMAPNPFVMLIAYLGYFYYLYTVFMAYVSLLEANLLRQKQAAWHASKHVASRVAIVLGTGALLKTFYDVACKYRQMSALRGMEEQAFMHPSDEDIAKIDANDVTDEIAVEHNWANVVCAPLPSSEASKTITEDDLMQLCKRNTACLVDDGKLITNMFFVKSNVALLPTHLIKSVEEKLYTIVRQDVTTVGGNFKSFISLQNSAQIPDTDLSLVWIPNGGSWKDLTKYFPETVFKENFGMRMCTRDVTGSNTEYRSFASYCSGQLTSCTAFGYSYTVTSFVGMCGAPVIAQKIAPMIVGVHVAGKVAKYAGFAPALARSDLEYALEVLAARPSVLIGASKGQLKPVIYDKPMLDEQAVHVKSPVNRLEIVEGATPNIEVYGSCSGRATYYSKVVPSVISGLVTKVCGVPQKWGKPKFGSGDPWLESLKYSSKPSCGVEPSLLDRAIQDYLKPLYQLLNDRENVCADIKPLTKMQTICGRDGKKFINKMAPKTAIGHPLTGSKENWLTYLDPDDFEDFHCPAELDAQFWDEFDCAIDAWSRGERYHPVFKGCLKDEATPIDKDKVRIFQGAPMVIQLGVRKYFLPVARVLSLFPKLSECAVGLNCMGPEWEEFQSHIKKFGANRILAGDYSKYDLRMPAQLSMAAFKVFIELARKAGYSEVDLTIMSSIATDICYPTIAFNGDLLQFVGSNPSGHNLTVYINSIVNSLLMRCAFFHLVAETAFQENVALGTYGDDVKGSVREGLDQFNHLSVAEFFRERDMKFTMPDKTSTPVPYMRDSDADFLKRQNVYIPALKQHCGALNEDSIFKSLHANVKSKALTPNELAANCIDGALREWFYHGREVYEKRRSQMSRIAADAGIANLCTMPDVPFDMQADTWRARYKQDTNWPNPEYSFTVNELKGLQHYAGIDSDFDDERYQFVPIPYDKKLLHDGYWIEVMEKGRK